MAALTSGLIHQSWQGRSFWPCSPLAPIHRAGIPSVPDCPCIAGQSYRVVAIQSRGGDQFAVTSFRGTSQLLAPDIEVGGHDGTVRGGTRKRVANQIHRRVDYVVSLVFDLVPPLSKELQIITQRWECLVSVS